MFRFVRHHLAALLTACAVLSLALGVHGFRSMNASTTVATAGYRSVQLFYWNYFPWDTAAEARVPWTLEAARWLAPLVTLGALLGALLAVSHRRWDAWCARRRRDHLVVVGAGKAAATLAADAAAGGRAVVVIADDPPEAARVPGVIHLPGDGGEASLLAAGAAAARQIVFASADDQWNLARAAAAARCASLGGTPPGRHAGTLVAVHARCSDVALSALFQRQLSAAEVPVRVFSDARNLARCIFAANPPESPAGEVHVFLPALDAIGSALAVEYALVGHFTGDRRVQLHVVAADAEAAAAGLRARVPGIDRCCRLRAHSSGMVESFAAGVARLVGGLAAEARVTIFPGWGDEARTFTEALALHEALAARAGVRLILAAAADGPARALVAAHAALRPRVGFFPLVESSGCEAVIGEVLDRTARRIHDNWLAETRRQIEAARAAGREAQARAHEAKATFREWPALTEEQKGASRSQADHLAVKVRAAGLDPATVTPEAWARLTPEQVETLARMEHARWAAYLYLTGWSHAPVRDDARREHPNLVPYEDLDEPTRDYDRAAVRHVADYLPALCR